MSSSNLDQALKHERCWTAWTSTSMPIEAWWVLTLTMHREALISRHWKPRPCRFTQQGWPDQFRTRPWLGTAHGSPCRETYLRL